MPQPGRPQATRTWTRRVEEALRSLGHAKEYIVREKQEQLPHGDTPIQPDVVWFFKNGETVRAIFELESQPSQYKHAYGSLLNGVMLGMGYRCAVILVARKLHGKSVKDRIQPAMKLLKRFYKNIHIIELGPVHNYRQAYQAISYRLKNIGLLK